MKTATAIAKPASAKAAKQTKATVKVTEINLSGKPFNCIERNGKYEINPTPPDIPDNRAIHYIGESLWLNVQNVLLPGIPQEYEIRLKYKGEEVRITGDSSQIYCGEVMNIYDLPLKLAVKAFSSLRDDGYKVLCGNDKATTLKAEILNSSPNDVLLEVGSKDIPREKWVPCVFDLVKNFSLIKPYLVPLDECKLGTVTEKETAEDAA
ncbi:MAG: hypothetical protein LBH25_09640 [Fibromonadaceae bacterium]|jgi:hypothetical protein|nr:hypothetical protein [Fibromonadaceae bacterium]